jgi:hypothetical protein
MADDVLWRRRDDDLFEVIGFGSLLGLQLIAAVERSCGLDVPEETVVSPTVVEIRVRAPGPESLEKDTAIRASSRRARYPAESAEEEARATGTMDRSTFVGQRLAADEPDVLREGVRVLAQAIMVDAEVTAQVGAEASERTGERTAYRNGFRPRTWATRVGTRELAIPQVTPGTDFPALRVPRRRGDRALVAVVQEAYGHGGSTRKGDDVMRALGLEGIATSEVSRVCAPLDAEVEACRGRAIAGEHPYGWLDATYHKGREDGRVLGGRRSWRSGSPRRARARCSGAPRARRRTRPSGPRFSGTGSAAG